VIAILMVAKPLLAIPMVAKLIAIPMVAAKPEKRLGVYKTPSIGQERERVRSVQDGMPRSDIEVFDYLTSSSETTTAEIDYLTYALFAYRKRQWIDHFTSGNGKEPTQRDIDGWISQLTDYEFVQMRKQAAEFFKDAAEEYLRDYVSQQRAEAVEHSILSEVRIFTSPWRHVSIALLMAIVAPLILGGLVFLWSLFDASFPFHISFTPPTQK
jgi:hypothetical protein